MRIEEILIGLGGVITGSVGSFFTFKNTKQSNNNDFVIKIQDKLIQFQEQLSKEREQMNEQRLQDSKALTENMKLITALQSEINGMRKRLLELELINFKYNALKQELEIIKNNK